MFFENYFLKKGVVQQLHMLCAGVFFQISFKIFSEVIATSNILGSISSTVHSSAFAYI